MVLIVFSVLFLASVSNAQELDLKEANVVDVERSGDRFSVTMIHDDEGEEGYANWWQVETLEGERLGRRTLLHPHGTREFTRSENIEMVEGVQEVAVRAHDQTHGYGGQAAIYNLQEDSYELIQQGSEAENFSTNSGEPFQNETSGSVNDSSNEYDKGISENNVEKDIEPDKEKSGEDSMISSFLGWLGHFF